MKSALIVAASLLAISTTASAGTYLGLGIGTEPGVNGEFSALVQPSGRSARFMVGQRFGNFSIEGALTGFDLVADRRPDQREYELSAAAKYNLPLSSGFEVFGRAGLERTWLSYAPQDQFTGNGFLLGAGIEYRLNLGIGATSLWIDYNVHHAGLENARNKVDETARIWTLGFSIGL